MGVRARLVLFAAALGMVFGLSFGVGRAMDADGPAPDPVRAEEHGGAGSGGHGDDRGGG